MGNNFGANRGGGAGVADWVPNIPADLPANAPDVQDNNLNQPYRNQILDVVFQWAVPSLCVAALAYTEYLRKKKEAQLDACQQESELNCILVGRNRNTHFGPNSGTLSEVLKVAEDQEDKVFQDKMEKLKYYEQGLETILDIKCSLFKHRDGRERLEEEMVGNLIKQDSDLSSVISYHGIREVAKYDDRFCGNSKATNGKLRQLYVQNWQLQLQRDKYRNIVQALHNIGDPASKTGQRHK